MVSNCSALYFATTDFTVSLTIVGRMVCSTKCMPALGHSLFLENIRNCQTVGSVEVGQVALDGTEQDAELEVDVVQVLRSGA
jgi:hypothetical protein